MEANQDQDLEALQTVYDELAKDARSIAADLNETVSAYYMLGFYLVAFSFGIDLYVILSHSIVLTDYANIAIFLIFGNAVPLLAGSFILNRYRKLNTKYKTLFRLENNLRLKEYKASAHKKAANGV
jgi:hypothetical protein